MSRSVHRNGFSLRRNDHLSGPISGHFWCFLFVWFHRRRFRHQFCSLKTLSPTNVLQPPPCESASSLFPWWNVVPSGCFVWISLSSRLFNRSFSDNGLTMAVSCPVRGGCSGDVSGAIEIVCTSPL